jgi:hypothetical protein
MWLKNLALRYTEQTNCIVTFVTKIGFNTHKSTDMYQFRGFNYKKVP